MKWNVKNNLSEAVAEVAEPRQTTSFPCGERPASEGCKAEPYPFIASRSRQGVRRTEGGNLAAQLPGRLAAFTLAEVLITLAIIGVVAAMTIPTLISNYQKKATVSKFQEAYGIISNAIKMAAVDNGDIETWDLSKYETNADKSKYFYETYLKPYLRVQKECIPTSSDCWTPAMSLSGGVASVLINSHDYEISFILNNGMMVYMWAGNNNTHAHIWVNVNGRKNNPVLGKDIFGMFVVLKSNGYYNAPGVHFHEDFGETSDIEQDSIYGCSKDVVSTRAGYYCAEIIRRNGWKIPDNYPW